MNYLDFSGNNLYSYDVGNINWEIGSWRQLIKVVPALEICRKFDVKEMADFGCGVGNVKTFLSQNGVLPKICINIDANKEVNPDILADVCINSGLLSDSLDFVSCLDLIQNIPIGKRQLLYKEIDRVLKTQGVVYLFFRNALVESDFENKKHHISGEYAQNIFSAFVNYEILSWWGVNSTKENNEWSEFFPFEFNRIFYSSSDLENSKFHGLVLRKN